MVQSEGPGIIPVELSWYSMANAASSTGERRRRYRPKNAIRSSLVGRLSLRVLVVRDSRS
jgi:hypothetical protein